MRKPQRIEKHGKVYWIMGLPAYQAEGKTEYAYGPYPNKADAESAWSSFLRTMKGWKCGDEYAPIHECPDDYRPVEPVRQAANRPTRRRRRKMEGSAKRTGGASVLEVGPAGGCDSVGATPDHNADAVPEQDTGRGSADLVLQQPESDRSGGVDDRARRRERGSCEVPCVIGPCGLVEYPFTWENDDDESRSS